MGEGPSVLEWVIKNQNKVGHAVTNVVWDHSAGKQTIVKGHRLTQLSCIGKRIIAKFIPKNSSDPNTSTISIEFCRGTPSRFRDNNESLMKLRFGRMSIEGKSVSTITLQRMVELEDLKLRDVTGEHFDPKEVVKAWKKIDQSKNFGTVLLDQKLTPGVGNVIRIECLHAFCLHPKIKLENIDDAKLYRIAKWLNKFATQWYRLKQGDSKSSDGPLCQLYWIDGDGYGHNHNQPAEHGKYRCRDMCPRCNVRVEKNGFKDEVGRSRKVFFCPQCQPDPKPNRGLLKYFNKTMSSSSLSSTSSSSSSSSSLLSSSSTPPSSLKLSLSLSTSKKRKADEIDLSERHSSKKQSGKEESPIVLSSDDDEHEE